MFLLDKALASAVRTGQAEKRLHSHIARHSYCTLLLNKGVPIKTVAKCAGHANTRITENFYAHLEDRTVLKQVSEALN